MNTPTGPTAGSLHVLVRRHPRYREHQRAMKLLSDAVDEREYWTRKFSAMDDQTTDAFVAAHLKMRRLQKKVAVIRASIAADFGVPITESWQLFCRPTRKPPNAQASGTEAPQ